MKRHQTPTGSFGKSVFLLLLGLLLFVVGACGSWPDQRPGPDRWSWRDVPASKYEPPY